MRKFIRALTRPMVLKVWWMIMNRLHDHCVESAEVSLQTRVGFRSIIRHGTHVGSDVDLGDFSYISGPGTYVESAQIGRFCSIARGSVIGVSGKDASRVTTHDFITGPEYGQLTQALRLPDQKVRPVIGHDVWVGYGAVIMRGVTIGNGAIIGAKSVVTRNVPAYAVVGGNPARHIRDRFPAQQIAALERIAWWDWSHDKLAATLTDFFDVEHFVALHDPCNQEISADQKKSE